MKLFKETPVNDGYKTLQDDIKKTTDELQIVYTNLENGSRKPLRRFMIDEKIPADKRDEIALLADGDHIMWIIGRRISSYYKIGPDTRRVLQAKVSQSTLS
jgi:tRNA(Ile)-lysidine synthetase-like protein